MFLEQQNRETEHQLERLGQETNKGGIVLLLAKPVSEFKRHLDVFLEEGMMGRGLVEKQKGGIKIN